MSLSSRCTIAELRVEADMLFEGDLARLRTWMKHRLDSGELKSTRLHAHYRQDIRTLDVLAAAAAAMPQAANAHNQ